jgi:hypothetical protein
MVELYLHSPLCLYGIVLNYIIMYTDSSTVITPVFMYSCWDIRYSVPQYKRVGLPFESSCVVCPVNLPVMLPYYLYH